MIRKPLQKTEFKNLLSFRHKSKKSEKTVKTVTNFENADDENDPWWKSERLIPHMPYVYITKFDGYNGF